MQRPVECKHPMMAMVTRGQRAAACPAPPLFDDQFDACEPRVCRPAVWHDGPLLVQDVVGHYHTSAGPIYVLAFCRTVVLIASRRPIFFTMIQVGDTFPARLCQWLDVVWDSTYPHMQRFPTVMG